MVAGLCDDLPRGLLTRGISGATVGSGVQREGARTPLARLTQPWHTVFDGLRRWAVPSKWTVWTSRLDMATSWSGIFSSIMDGD